MALALRADLQRRRQFVDASRIIGFDYVDGNLVYQGIPRVAGGRLRELCFPETVEDPEKRRLAIEESKKLFKKKPWFAAQSTFYHFRLTRLEMKTLSGLRYDLCELVKMGRCDEPTREVAAIEAAFKDAERMWRDREKIFLDFESPTIRAVWDFELFKQHYFLTEGRPDPTKTREPLVLSDMDDVLTDNIVDLVEEIELELDTGTTRMGSPFAVIGWNGVKVMEAAAEISAGPYLTSEPPNALNRAWRGAMAVHREYLADTAAAELKNATSSKPRSRKMRLDDAVGSYVIKCPTILSDWPEYGPIFHLEIKDRPGREGDDGLLSAKMNLGIVEGTMLLSFSKETLNMTSKVTRLDAVDALSRITVAEIPEYHIPSTANDENKNIAIEERMAESRKRSAPALRSKSDGSPPPQKKAKLNTRQVMRGRRRLYFIWRGTENDNDSPVENKGYLDFNDTCTGFKGVTWLDFAIFDRDAGLEDCTFQGFKVETMKPQLKKVRLSDSEEDTEASDFGVDGSESDLDEIPASCLINFELRHGA